MNANKLKGKIVEKGLTIAKVSDLIGVSRPSLYRKLSYHDKLTISEAIKIKEVLKLTDLEALDIFLTPGRNDNESL